VTPNEGDRARHFPAIEKKHGKPVAHWLRLIAKMGDARYPEQMALLQEKHGFSRAHANALVMYSRGSVTSRRHASPGAFFATLTPAAARTAKAIFAAVTKKHPELELVIAWNQPMLKSGDQYVFGLSTTKSYILLGPWSKNAISTFSKELKDYTTNKKTVAVPSDWKVDATLLNKFVKARLDELK